MKAITKDLEICAVYMIINTKNGKRYIGSSKNVRNRLWGHRANLRHNKHYNHLLQDDWNEYGENSFEYSIIEICTIENKFDREQYYVQTLNPEYNICIDDVKNPPQMIESHKKQSITRKQRMATGEISITNNKPVYVYYKDGSFVGHWNGIKPAARALGIHCSSAHRVVQGIDTQTNGYKFFLEPQEYVAPFKKKKAENSKKYIVTNIETNEEIEFESLLKMNEYFNASVKARNFILSNKPYKRKYMIKYKTAVS